MLSFDLSREQLETYRGSSPRPADFDDYWKRALEELDEQERRGFEPEWKRPDFQVPFAECRSLYFTGVRGARIHARCVFPIRAEDSTDSKNPVPAVFRFHGYSMNAGNWSSILPFAAAGMAVFAMDVRGQGGESTDPGGAPGNTLLGHVVRGIEGEPDDLFYRQIFLDTAALVRIAAGMPEIDNRRLGAFGASQGGGLTLACAALEPRIRCAWAVYPFLSDYHRVWDMESDSSACAEMCGWLRRRDPRHEKIDHFLERLGYIDIQNLADRIGAHVVMVTGLADQVCPPSAQFAAYNRLDSAASRRVILYPDFGHEDLPDEPDTALTWFLEQLAEL